MSPTLTVACWGAGFLLLHLVLTHPPIRDPLVARLKITGFQTVFSLLALTLLSGMAWTWWHARHQGPLLWMLRTPVSTRLVEGWVILSYALIGAGLASPAPSTAGMRLDGPIAIQGATALTRHPMMMGMAGWASGHLLMNGWASDVAFLGLFAATALLGSAHQDWRKSRESPDYAAFVAQTHFLPLPTPSALRAVTGRAWAGAAAGAALALFIRNVHGWMIAL